MDRSAWLLIAALWAGLSAFAAAQQAGPRAPVPTVEAQQESLRLVEELFEADLKKAQTAAKLTTAQKMFNLSSEQGNDRAGQYTLLRRSLDLSIEVAQPALAWQAVDALAQNFELDALALKVETLERLAATVKFSTALKTLAESATRTEEALLAAERLDLAPRALEIGLAAAAKSRATDLTKALLKQRQMLEELTKDQAVVSASLKTLQQDPSHAQANLIVGKYRCLIQQDWSTGLDLLAKCADAKLVNLAKLERDQPGQADALVQLADGWWDWGQDAAEREKQGALRRALTWYEKALPSLTGIVKIRAERRVADNRALLGPSALETTVATTAPVTPAPNTTTNPKTLPRAGGKRLLPGLVVADFARVKSQDGGSGGFVPLTKLGPIISSGVITDGVGPWKFKETRNALAFGFLKIETSGDYVFDSNNFYDQNALYLNGTEVCRYRDGTKSAPIKLEAGLVPFLSLGYAGARGSVDVKWQPPGQSALSPIPPSLFAHDPDALPDTTSEFESPALDLASAEQAVALTPAQAKKLVPGLLAAPYARHASQPVGAGAFVEDKDLGPPIGPSWIVYSVSPVAFPAENNLVVRGFLKIDVPGEYAFNGNCFYDRNALLVAGKLLCPYRDGENKVNRIVLNKGLFPIVVQGFVEARGQVDIKWQPPGQSELCPIPPQALFFLPTDRK